MIINTGSRTDTVQYYTQWLLKRFEEGFVYSRNPMYPDIVTKYDLNPETLDCVIFCSKNYEPILPYITQITDRFNTYFHYTITAYGSDVEPRVPTIDKSIETLIKLSEIVGTKRIAWRYDPVLLTEKYTKKVHAETFEYMAERISPYVDRCIFSFVEMYKKLKTNMPEIILLTEDDKNELAQIIGNISQKYNLYTQTCATNGIYEKYNIHSSGCITLDTLGKANNVKFKSLKHNGTRANCGCYENRNIGDYDTCPNGCKYCYANQNPQIALENFKKHNPNLPFILGNLKETDTVQQSKQKSIIIKENFQQKLF